MGNAVSPVEQGGKRRSVWPKLVIGVFFGAVIFSFGVAVGSGQIRVSGTASLQKAAPEKLDYSSVDEVYDKIRTDFDGKLDNEKLLDGLKQGLAQATGDPYTEYFNAKSAKEFNEQLSGTFSGIGAELGKDTNSNIVVISPLSGYPAEKAGLKAKDIIVAVNGETTAGQTIDEAVGKIRGQAGTKVKLTVVRGDQRLELEITREEIKVPSVDSKILDGNIGYLKISRFGDDTSDLARKAADTFKDAKVKGVVLDLRGDPGGLLSAAVDVSSLWLDDNRTVLQEKRGGIVTKTYTAEGNPVLKGISTVVLINEGSASASEITAGALRDNKAATLLGTKSYGKGSVQQIECLDGLQRTSSSCSGAFVKVTIAHWFTPSGKTIDKQGITPDKTVELSDDDAKNQRDPQKDAAIQLLNKY